MCGVPGQSFESWAATLEQAVATGARHVSVYPLAVEEGTPLAVAIAEGRVAAPGPGRRRRHDARRRGGARRRRACRATRSRTTRSRATRRRHNVVYWTGGAYLGLGPHAASMLPYEALRARRGRPSAGRTAPHGEPPARARFTHEQGPAPATCARRWPPRPTSSSSRRPRPLERTSCSGCGWPPACRDAQRERGGRRGRARAAGRAQGLVRRVAAPTAPSRWARPSKGGCSATASSATSGPGSSRSAARGPASHLVAPLARRPDRASVARVIGTRYTRLPSRADHASKGGATRCSRIADGWCWPPSSQEYVRSAQPVASRQLVDRYDLKVSPATVRNELSVLEESGLRLPAAHLRGTRSDRLGLPCVRGRPCSSPGPRTA